MHFLYLIIKEELLLPKFSSNFFNTLIFQHNYKHCHHFKLKNGSASFQSTAQRFSRDCSLKYSGDAAAGRTTTFPVYSSGTVSLAGEVTVLFSLEQKLVAEKPWRRRRRRDLVPAYLGRSRGTRQPRARGSKEHSVGYERRRHQSVSCALAAAVLRAWGQF